MWLNIIIVSSNTYPRYLTCERCFIFTCLCLIFTWWTFFDLRFLEKRINLVLSTPKFILTLLSTNQSTMFSNSLLSCFSIPSTSLCWYKMHESSAYKSWFDCLWHSVHIDKKNKRVPKIDPCGNPQEMFLKSESLLSILTRNIHWEI